MEDCDININIYNLYDQVTYMHDTIDKCLIVSWDDRDPIIKTLHLMILNVLVERSPMKIFWSKDKFSLSRYEKIDENGYLYVNWYDHKAQLTDMVKKDCLYNRDWELIYEYPYIFK